ncbi:MAG: 2-amino-4-hydroxy-6-hydroxymethyldihydropteridine diphosphokinase [Gammaproteobacteria bacterium]|nr:2-amino-4-hydroxy-6-hydroxymethyldihydropteridine diphosphokinase [Gammaproteobacteria bacterium]MBI5617505.1 2-amino-4-hydroxy-6-hydroxymethyldihydropteridine diphosphokinase [Gammaproteobacteria bacterium]
MTSAASAPVRVHLGFGSNLDDPAAQVLTAVAEVGAIPGVTLVCCSNLYRTTPLGPAGQPDYVNAVAACDTTLEPHALLDALQAIETAHGRVRAERWGARTLDIDLLLYGERVIADARLTVPHAELAAREFVVLPLLEIAPDLVVPGLGPVRKLAARFDPDSVTRL